MKIRSAFGLAIALPLFGLPGCWPASEQCRESASIIGDGFADNMMARCDTGQRVVVEIVAGKIVARCLCVVPDAGGR